MLIRRADTVDPKPMEMEGASGVYLRMMVGRDDGTPNFALRHFTLEVGGHTPRHQHNYEHEIMVLDGSGVAMCGDTPHKVSSGDVIFVPANELHQFRNTGEQTFRFMCIVPTQFDCGDGSCSPTPGS